MKFVTGNANKLEEARQIIDGLQSVKLDLVEIQSMNIEEIVKHKAEEAYEKLGEPCFVEDVSLEIESLKGLPGPFIKWFNETIGAAKLAQLSGVSRANAIGAIGYHDGENVQAVKGIVEGKIVAARGESGFGFDPIFQPEGYSKTYAEMSKEEKNAVSHRRKALEALKASLARYK